MAGGSPEARHGGGGGTEIAREGVRVQERVRGLVILVECVKHAAPEAGARELAVVLERLWPATAAHRVLQQRAVALEALEPRVGLAEQPGEERGHGDVVAERHRGRVAAARVLRGVVKLHASPPCMRDLWARPCGACCKLSPWVMKVTLRGAVIGTPPNSSTDQNNSARA